jgi:hypothetical protein
MEAGDEIESQPELGWFGGANELLHRFKMNIYLQNML